MKLAAQGKKKEKGRAPRRGTGTPPGTWWHLLTKMWGGHASGEVTKTEAPMNYFIEKTAAARELEPT